MESGEGSEAGISLLPLPIDDLDLEEDDAGVLEDPEESGDGASIATILAATNAELDAVEDDLSRPPASSSRSSSPGLFYPDLHDFRPIIVDVPASTLINPRSAFQGYEPPLPVEREWKAVQGLLDFDRTQLDKKFVEFELDQFAIYVDGKTSPSEMRPLHHLSTKKGCTAFKFDGILSIGNRRYYVSGRPFMEVPLGNYGREQPTVGDQLWIRSVLNKHREIYYRLKRPAPEYRRFHGPFLWVADLAKHFVDYCEWMTCRKHEVSIHSFSNGFSGWLLKTHKKSPSFKAWYEAYGSEDFRSAIVAHQEFLYKEWASYSTLYKKRLPKGSKALQLFREIRDFTRYKSIAPLDQSDIPQTIVTRYIYDCFSHMQVGGFLEPTDATIGTAEAIRASWPLPDRAEASFIQEARNGGSRVEMIANIRPGDTISTPPDGENTDSKWKGTGNTWFGLVQNVHLLKNGSRCFDVIWLYQPTDTPCCSMRYPFTNELFLSDHCTCKQGKSLKVYDKEVLRTHSVEWLGSPSTEAEYFVRQTYTTEERRFVTLRTSHLKCNHERKELKYRIGDTVLAAITPGESDVLEPCEIVDLYSEGDAYYAKLRQYLRRRSIDPACPPNELLYTERYTTVRVSKIEGKCLIRCFLPGTKIPTPYDRNGAGNVFFITHEQQVREGETSVIPLTNLTKSCRQGFDPAKRCSKLRSLDLFCGCGNLGRGLEDGGAVKTKWVNDIWDRAIHTHMANCKSPGSVKPFLGSVDDLLHLGLRGDFSASVPKPGEVDLIAGGSPCPGFSVLTNDRTTPRQLKNRSLVASFASFIDFYRPKYGILENVPTIVPSPANRKEDFFSQLICAIVGMGYQAQVVLGDAWAYGAPQQRVRAFLYFAAPGVPLPEAPRPSHSHPSRVNLAGLGKLTNGEPYVRRERLPTAFRYVSASDATGDLPDILDAKVDTCVPFPDHRLSQGITSGDASKTNGQKRRKGRPQILNIPTVPYGMSFSKAWQEGKGVMTTAEREVYPPKGALRTSKESRAFGRISPRQLFSTVTAAQQYQNARSSGRQLHWNQPRPLTVMEARRAQGIPDDEVLVGDVRDQWKMVGNSVARQIAMAFGLAFREAWCGSLYDDDDERPVLTQLVDEPAEAQESMSIEGDVVMLADVDESVVVQEDGTDSDEDDDVLLSNIEETDSSSKWSGMQKSPDDDVHASHALTPDTSAPDTDDVDTVSGAGPRRKRPLYRALAAERLTSKRVRSELEEPSRTPIYLPMRTGPAVSEDISHSHVYDHLELSPHELGGTSRTPIYLPVETTTAEGATVVRLGSVSDEEDFL